MSRAQQHAQWAWGSWVCSKPSRIQGGGKGDGRGETHGILKGKCSGEGGGEASAPAAPAAVCQEREETRDHQRATGPIRTGAADQRDGAKAGGRGGHEVTVECWLVGHAGVLFSSSSSSFSSSSSSSSSPDRFYAVCLNRGYQ